jgi:hypothetical protein
LETRTEPPKEEETMLGSVAQTYGNLAGFGSGVLMLENGPMGGGLPGGIPPPMPHMGGMGMQPDMSGFGIPPPGMMPMMANGGMHGMAPPMQTM